MPSRRLDLPLAISVGDPAGIGPEIIGKAWEARKAANLPPFFAIGDMGSFTPHWDGPVVKIDDPADSFAHFNSALPVIEVHNCISVIPGEPDLDGAHCAYQALEMAIGFARAGSAAALVTGPVSKTQLYAVGFTHPGQTEFIAERCGVSKNNAVMMLAGPDLRVVPMTTHIPLASVASKLDGRLIRQRLRATAKGLQRNFGIENPRLAVAGFNPHAGESGNMGREEIDIFEPAIAQIRSEGFDVVGPLSADTMFHAEARSHYDAALCAYHDQALIPLKTLYFHDAVNITLGLPVVRTSPDHGTAFGIAGQNIAMPNSMIAAIKMAEMAALNRQAADAA
ncbi:4-hydroxythreonine-4-phosphate dehydrogenase PdxA [Sphingorhabdus sp. IMCC26285]|uniref:4-hydroxythreonine-4-phosphate dehydrogenase n=1 Tax=Sphingorhabdus profundilacus TaxID=2509718 RepID=A0A6I4LV87_9SPHN|nr:4-hydroxythreonine-4-phosphate dehydrogenase PdxA [Sphingorhabdus profundilacus]MVZ97282.1 4-hydroxythreonine-4-phosphate dehydrogenase PdxA [Sphingorhabdus profundilacus]